MPLTASFTAGITWQESHGKDGQVSMHALNGMYLGTTVRHC
jgi:hypothetical protein